MGVNRRETLFLVAAGGLVACGDAQKPPPRPPSGPPQSITIRDGQAVSSGIPSPTARADVQPTPPPVTNLSPQAPQPTRVEQMAAGLKLWISPNPDKPYAWVYDTTLWTIGQFDDSFTSLEKLAKDPRVPASSIYTTGNTNPNYKTTDEYIDQLLFPNIQTRNPEGFQRTITTVAGLRTIMLSYYETGEMYHTNGRRFKKEVHFKDPRRIHSIVLSVDSGAVNKYVPGFDALLKTVQLR